MTTGALPTYHIFLSSPSDVEPERECAVHVIRRLSNEFRNQVIMEVTNYRALSYRADRPPQSDIKKAEECDLVVGILWSRIGMELDPDIYCRADGRPYQSGTVYEIETSLTASKRTNGTPRVLLFHKTIKRQVDLSDDPKEMAALSAQLRETDTVLKEWTVSSKGHFHGGLNEFTSGG